MTLINLSSLSPWLSRLSHSSPPLPIITTNATNALLFRIQTTSINFSKLLTTKASLGESESGSGLAEDSVSELLDDELLSKVSGAKDAQEALQMIAEITGRNGGFVSASDCCAIVSAALKRNNPDLALSVFYEMRASFDQGIGLGFNISCSYVWKTSIVFHHNSTFQFSIGFQKRNGFVYLCSSMQSLPC